jgi:hypothetical protein
MFEPHRTPQPGRCTITSATERSGLADFARQIVLEVTARELGAFHLRLRPPESP